MLELARAFIFERTSNQQEPWQSSDTHNVSAVPALSTVKARASSSTPKPPLRSAKEEKLPLRSAEEKVGYDNYGGPSELEEGLIGVGVLSRASKPVSSCLFSEPSGFFRTFIKVSMA